MKTKQFNPNEVHHSTGNRFKTTAQLCKDHQANVDNESWNYFWQGIAIKLMKLFIIVFILLFISMMLSSCGQRENTTYLYRVQFITSGAKTVVVDIEKGIADYGSYSVGDTVHINHGDSITTDGRYRKAVIISELGIKY